MTKRTIFSMTLQAGGDGMGVRGGRGAGGGRTSIFSPSLLIILDMQMGVTVIPCQRLPGGVAVPRTLSTQPPFLTANSLSAGEGGREGGAWGGVLCPRRRSDRRQFAFGMSTLVSCKAALPP